MPIVFPEAETSFAAGLARWISSPPGAQAAGKAAGVTDTAPASSPASADEQVAPFEAECAALEAKEDYASLVGKLRDGVMSRFTDANEDDVRTAYAVFLELLVRWQLLESQAEGLAAELTAKPTELCELRTALLLSLYSLAQQHNVTSDLRIALLLRLIKFCTDTGELSKVLGPVDQRMECVERWVREWELSTSQQKELWGLVFDAHADDGRVMYDCALKYFSLHGSADLSSLPAMRERLVQGVLLTIRSPELFRCDELSQLEVVQKLKADSDFAPLHRLLHIMARETYSEFLTYSSDGAAQAFMKQHGIPMDACATKMRLLTLVSLGHAKKELTYAAVAEALRVGVNEVEPWVMQAIGAGLITAKMDQVREVIAVSMCAERDFGQKQWERLHGNLVEWRDSISALLEVLHSARPTAPAS